MAAVTEQVSPSRDALSALVTALVERHGGPTKVGEKVGAHRTTVHQWMKGNIPLVAMGQLAEKLEESVTLRFGPGHEEEAPRPAWVEGLVAEIRLNRAVIQAAFAVGDPDFVQRVARRLGAPEEPHEQPDDAARADEGGAASVPPSESGQT